MTGTTPDDYRDLFEVDTRGRRVLEHLERRFASQPPVVTDGGIDAVLKTYERAAHRAVLDFIHTQIARASGDEPNDTPEAEASGD